MMSNIVKRIFFVNSILTFFIFTPYLCYAADWSDLMELDGDLGQESSGYSESDEDMPDEDADAGPQRMPVCSDYYKKNIEPAVDEPGTVQPLNMQREEPVSKRNYQQAFNNQEEPPARSLRRPRQEAPKVKTSAEILEDRKNEKLEILNNNKLSDQVIFKLKDDENIFKFSCIMAPRLRKDLEEQYSNGPQYEFEAEKESLEACISDSYSKLELAACKNQIAVREVWKEREKNILFVDLFLGIDEDPHFSGLPTDLWAIIFDIKCEEDCSFRANFALLSKRSYEIAQRLTKKLKVSCTNLGTDLCLKNLTHLLIKYPRVDSLSVEAVILPLTDIIKTDKESKIKHLRLTGQQLFWQNENFDGILTRLESLKLNDVHLLTPNFKRNLSNIKTLSVDSKNCPLFPFTGDEIKQYTNLRSLSFEACRQGHINDAVITFLTNLTYLGVLKFGSSRQAELSFSPKALEQLTNLVELDAPGAYKNLPADKNYSLGGLSRYKKVELAEYDNLFQVGSAGPRRQVNKLGRFQSLIQAEKDAIETLYINQDKCVMDDLKSLRNLRELHLGSCKNIGINTLKQLTNLRCLHIDENDKIKNHHFKSLTHLEELSLKHDYKVGCLTSLQLLTNLTKLDLGRSSKVSDKDIRNLTKLVKLKLGASKEITNQGIMNLVHLRQLDLGEDAHITVAGIERLTDLVELK